MVVLCGVWCVFWLQKEFQPPPILTRPPLVVKADAADGQAFVGNEASPFCLILAGFRTLPLAPLLLRDAGDPTHSLIQNKKAALSEYVQDGISQPPWRELERGTSVFRISISTSISATLRSIEQIPMWCFSSPVAPPDPRRGCYFEGVPSGRIRKSRTHAGSSKK
jgi:hypothetical protein